MEDARRRKKDKFFAWLDISNAFGSVPRQVVVDALIAVGADQDFIALIVNIYEDATTQVLTEEGPTPPIALRSGVKQGCPLSGILFNLAIDQVLHAVQEGREHRAILAFADDLVLLADSAEELQEMIQTTADELHALCLHLNVRKCASLHLAGTTPVAARATTFTVNNEQLKALQDGEYYSYLGKPVGFFLQRTYGSVNEALQLLVRISSSHLAPWQKIDALKSFFFPSLSFAMRTAQIDKTSWAEVDNAARKELKNLLSLPPMAANQYLHGSRKFGGCGLPSAAHDSDYYLVDSAFKLLTSKDEEVAVQALGQLTRTVRHRVQRSPTDGDLSSYLSGSMEDEFAETSNQLSNTWTLARQASRRQEVTWSFCDGLPTLSFGDEFLTAGKRRTVMRAFHGKFQLDQTTDLLKAPSQGKVMDCVAMSPASSHFITEGKYTRFADWRFIHKARLNLTALNGSKHWLPADQKRCRKCGKWEETLPHVINHCPAYSAAWQMRHNSVLSRIQKAVAFKGTVLHSNQVVGSNGLRPDLVALIDNKIYIIDVTIPFENRRVAFQQARWRKVEKCTPLLQHFASLGFAQAQIVPIVVGALGAWDPENDSFLRLVATKSYTNVLRKLCVSDCIRWSRDIYVQHLTGARQYSVDAAETSDEPKAVCEATKVNSDIGSSADSNATIHDSQSSVAMQIVSQGSNAVTNSPHAVGQTADL
ncbi:retrovirus-related Pol polyprotein from type-1 retrotransposable element R2 [Trichonephila clavata]|uniref:Retrovirus-related Pol polyprotein from type-1 retrotransposable element R2 n=1 Tax=Trichonephila clavata TaxID=2740835 RepID=A0A8X6GC09_TRICU|nr:retrovirus-related Pol polyprotein from type-1 retrotransposable element R2 [Trichonephila clavata]